MKTPKSFTKQVTAALLTTVALQGCGGNPSGQALNANDENSNHESIQNDDIFVDAGADAEAQVQSDNEPIYRKRLAKVNFAVLKRLIQGPVRPETIRLNLFDDDQIAITLEEVQQISENNFVVSGRIVGDDDSAVTLVMNDGVLVANIKRGQRDESYEVRYAGNGIHVVSVPDFARGDEQDCETVEPPADEQADNEPMIDEGDATTRATPVIDMLVAYTPKARAAQGGTSAIKALIQMGIADTNAAMANSGANIQVRLAGTMETKTSETSSMSNDLSSLRSKTDSKWNEVHTERARLGADQVTLVAAYSGISTAAGIGYVRSTSSSAFTVVKAYYFKQYTFSHELGHNIGLNHSDGYQNTSGRFRTIMAYGNYTRIRRYSNPSLRYNGYLTGTSSHNSVKILNARGSITAALLRPTSAITTP